MIDTGHGSLNTETTGCRTSLPTVGLGYRSLEMIIRAHICQRLVKRPENKIVNQAPIAETHFVLGGVNIHVHVRGINLQIQHERRVTVVVKHIPISLAHGMRYQPVPYHPPVDKKVLQIRLTAEKVGNATHPHSLRPVASASITTVLSINC